MDGQFPYAAETEAEIRLTRVPKSLNAADFVARLQAMQKTIGARHFAVLRVSGHGLPAARKLTCALHNWGVDAEQNARLLIEAYGAELMAHLDASLLPLLWQEAGEHPSPSSGLPPFTMRLPAKLVLGSGIAFPVRLGMIGNGFVVFTGVPDGLSNDLVIDAHMKSCQILVDLLAADEKKMLPNEALSDREIACLQMAGDGCISEAIAEKMGLSVHTVNAYLGTATTKLDAVNRIQAIAKAIRLGYIN
ncbi:MAG: helix-turn-helix transcriptional regulator [Shinella sp.]|nr:helix-turn-helix transcriptional regulator [Shinella sp.]